MKRVALLCDVPGLWWAATKFKQGRVDYAKLRASVQGPQRQLEYCMAWLIDREGLDKFESALKHLGYDTTLVPRGNSIDQLIHNAALEVAQTCDVVCIAASSGRYIQLKDALVGMGCKLEIMAFPVECQLDEMKEHADRWQTLDEGVMSLKAS